jgi:hypothetical protein
MVSFGLSQLEYMVMILRKFGMNDVKLVKYFLAFHYKFSSGLCPSDEEEKGYMSRVWYASRKIDDCDERMRYFTCSWCCQWSHDKSRWSSEMGASVLEALVSPIFSLQEGDEWTMA